MTRSPEEITHALLEPFPKSAIKTRTDRGKALGYVEGHTVFRRLIEATGNNFDVAVIDQAMHEYGKTNSGTDRFLLTARVRLTIPGMGSREHMGVQVVMAGGGEDMWKGAISDAIKKAATLFGVGLELYGPDYEAGEVDDRAVSQRPAPRQDAPRGPAHAPSNHEAALQASEGLPHGAQPLTRLQQTTLFGLADDLAQRRGWARDWIKGPLYAAFAIASSADLTRAQASDAIDALYRMKNDEGLSFPDGLELRRAQPALVTAAVVPEREAAADRWTD